MTLANRVLSGLEQPVHHRLAQQSHFGDDALSSSVTAGQKPTGHARDLHEARRDAVHPGPGVAIAIDRLTAAPTTRHRLRAPREAASGCYRIVLGQQDVGRRRR